MKLKSDTTAQHCTMYVRVCAHSSCSLCCLTVPRLNGCFFLLLIPPPPRSTLFPYTTLFRSCLRLAERGARRSRTSVRLAVLALARSTASRTLVLLRRADRKSTRLNSSHTVISYAVFCLKKKKTKKNETKIRYNCSTLHHVRTSLRSQLLLAVLSYCPST